MKLSFKSIVEYVCELMPIMSGSVVPSDNPYADAAVLAHISAGKVFFTRVTNGGLYFYAMPSEEYFELAKYIMRGNGMKPRRHISNYYYNGTPVLRVPCSEIRNNVAATSFANRVMAFANANQDQDLVHTRTRINFLTKKMQQKMK